MPYRNAELPDEPFAAPLGWWPKFKSRVRIWWDGSNHDDRGPFDALIQSYAKERRTEKIKSETAAYVPPPPPSNPTLCPHMLHPPQTQSSFLCPLCFGIITPIGVK